MLNIAVDGYSSSGKGIVCSLVAKKLGIIHFDTGAIYRVIGLYVLENGIDAKNQELVEGCLDKIHVSVSHKDGEQITFLNGEDVSLKIRSRLVSDICSITSIYPKCREFVLKIQRDTAKNHDVIMEGRDITSHVLPNADFKFFLDANIDVRANRRYNDLIKAGEKVSLETVKADLIERDRRDTHRELSPLILTPGTYYIDNSEMTLEEEVDLIIRTIKGENN